MLLLTRPLPYQPRAMTLPNKLPAGFVVPAQPVERDAPPSGRQGAPLMLLLT